MSDEMEVKSDRSTRGVQRLLDHTFSAVSGDPCHYSLEHRLFNTISLLNAVTNIGGAFAITANNNHTFLLILQLGTGVLFLIFYYLSRFRNLYRSLYWPFVLMIVAFLFINSLRNAGSMGGAHYYFIPALVIAIVLSRKVLTTMNTASRLESSGQAGRINISRTTYEQVKEFFVCEYRGRVAAKNKGDIDMYFVEGIRPELARGSDRSTPNERFLELYRRIKPDSTLADSTSSVIQSNR
jgi:hypothetical protein